MYINALRLWLVKKLLGDGLALEVKETPSGHEVQLVDLKRRIPYGFWTVEKHSWRPRMFNLTWESSSGQKTSADEQHSNGAPEPPYHLPVPPPNRAGQAPIDHHFQNEPIPTRNRKRMRLSLKGCALIAAVDSGLLPEIERDGQVGYDEVLFNRFWYMYAELAEETHGNLFRSKRNNRTEDHK